MRKVVCRYCKSPISRGDESCKNCGRRIDWPPEEFWDNPRCWQDVCQNCKKDWHRGDKYCRYCGAPKGSSVYIIEEIEALYGPPVMVEAKTHHCLACGYAWGTELESDQEAICPVCGNKAAVEDGYNLPPEIYF